MRKSCIEYQENIDRLKELIRQGRPVVFFDLETTGVRPSFDRIVSFSAIKYVFDGKTLREADRMDMFINPGFHIPDGASAVNGITDEKVKNCPREYDAFDPIHRFLGDNPVVCGYNSVNFDEKFMDNMYMRQSGKNFTPEHHTDVIKMARECVECSSYKLSEVTHEMGCDKGISFHMSIEDVIATKRLFDLLLPYYSKKNRKLEENRIRLYVKGLSLWERSYKMKRLYVKTYPYSKTYFDIFKKEWKSDIDNADLDRLKRDVFLYADVTDEKELARKAGDYR